MNQASAHLIYPEAFRLSVAVPEDEEHVSAHAHDALQKRLSQTPVQDKISGAAAEREEAKAVTSNAREKAEKKAWKPATDPVTPMEMKSKRQLVIDEASDSASSSETTSPTTRKKKKQVTGVAKLPTAAMLAYNTYKYELYDPALKNIGQHSCTAHRSFQYYNSYSLFIIPSVTLAKEIPKEGVRLDDNTVALVIESGDFRKKELNEMWKGEFDSKGMVRGLRVPLGHAAKRYKQQGDMDMEGNVLDAGEEGWYYLWYRGLHFLCGQEGLDAGIYLKRPAHEVDLCSGLTWFKSSRAIQQFAPGDPADLTFKQFPAFTKLTPEGTDLTQSTASSSKGVKADHAKTGQGKSGQGGPG